MRTLLMLFATLLLAAPAAQAQTSAFSLEVRGRAAFTTGDFGDEEPDGSGIKTGWGGSIEGIFQPTPILGLYAGYSYTRFDTELGGLEEELEGFVDDADVDVADTGLDAGLRATLPLGLSGGSVFVRGGVVYHQLGVELSDDLKDFLEEFAGGVFDPDDLDSEWSLGYQVGAGVLVPLGQRLSASLGVSYTAYEPEFERRADVTVQADDVSYLSTEAGLRIRL